MFYYEISISKNTSTRISKWEHQRHKHKCAYDAALSSENEVGISTRPSASARAYVLMLMSLVFSLAYTWKPALNEYWDMITLSLARDNITTYMWPQRANFCLIRYFRETFNLSVSYAVNLTFWLCRSPKSLVAKKRSFERHFLYRPWPNLLHFLRVNDRPH